MRIPDWEDRLAAVLDDLARAPHVYGSHDCGLFVATCVAAMTGVDFAAGLRGRYRTALGSTRALRRNGHRDIAAAITGALGSPGPLAFAHRGDVCWYAGTPGILQAREGVFVGGGEGDRELFGIGLVRVPRVMLDPLCAWTVPFE